jgi:hypothetical protein
MVYPSSVDSNSSSGGSPQPRNVIPEVNRWRQRASSLGSRSRRCTTIGASAAAAPSRPVLGDTQIPNRQKNLLVDKRTTLVEPPPPLEL